MIVSRWTWRSARRRRIAQLLFAVSLAAAVPAWAESDPTLMPTAAAVEASTAPASAVPPAVEPAPSADVSLPEVVVTSERELSSPKFTEPLRDVPQTITVIPQEVMREQNVTTLREVLRNVPGISIQAGEGGVPLGDNLSIRGFAARTDLFVDGVRDIGGYSRDPFNIEQVEVIKGPASSYAGQGSTGGAINMATKAPKARPFREASLGVGTDAYKRATLDLNQPLGAGMAFRLNGLWHDAEAPGRNAVEGSRWGVAPSLAFGLGTSTRLTAAYMHFSEDNLPDYGIPWVPQTNNALVGYRNAPPPVGFDNFYGVAARDYEFVKTDLATVKVEQDLGSAVTAHGLARYGKTSRDSIVTAPRFASDAGTAVNRNAQERLQDDETFTGQLGLVARFNTGAVAHAVSAGAESSRITTDRPRRFFPAAPQADLYDPNPSDPVTGDVSNSLQRDEAEADGLSGYLFDTLKIGEKWEVSGGLRWDSFAVDHVAVSSNGVSVSRSRTDEEISWRAGVVYKETPEQSVYFGFGTSFNPSAETLALTDATTNLEPETSRSYEVGVKRDVLAGRMALGAALFRTEKFNARTPGLAGEAPTVLSGKQRVDGAEFSAAGQVNERWTLFAAATFLESRVVKSNTAAEVNLELSNTPRQSYSLWTSYLLPWNLEAGAGAQYVGRRFNNVTAASRRQAPSYATYDLMLAYSPAKALTFRLNGTNLSDQRYIDRVGGGHFVPGPSRAVVLTTEVKF